MSQVTPYNGIFEDRKVGSITGKFVVPSYQRGYRWGKIEVTHLLDDIFSSAGETYYLQPVVVKKLGNELWELIDGQQRLTTLFLILQYIRKAVIPTAEVAYALEYTTRPDSANYLQNPTIEDSSKNIDFFHIHEAWTCISEWFTARGADKISDALDFYSYLHKSVKVIWFEAPENVISTDLFTRLNVGKIPLTDAELVKALMLAGNNKSENHAHRTLAMAAEWDSIEWDLRQPELWATFTGNSDPSPTHISLILDLLAHKPFDHESAPFYTFETLRTRISSDPNKFWDDVVDLHSMLMGWYEDRELYHKIGYLISAKVPFSEIYDLAQGAKKSEFIASLDSRISRTLSLTYEGLEELSYERLGDQKVLFDLLLLMNVETVRKIRNSSERYSFQAHARGKWSLEHIHAQNAEELHTAQQWEEWLRLHASALAKLPILKDAEHRGLLDQVNEVLTSNEQLSGETFRSLERRMTKYFVSEETESSGMDLHSVSNLALLDSSDNSVLSNSLFEVKRLEILQRDREGSYIPPCTRNIFLKYYTDEQSQQIHFWGIQDRAAYFDALVQELTPYIKFD